jgi:hypothetical protein
MNQADLIKIVFEAAGFQFIEQKPKGRLLFYYSEEERDVQFWFKPAKTVGLNMEEKNSLQRAMELISAINYDRGVRHGMETVRTDIKTALGI